MARVRRSANNPSLFEDPPQAPAEKQRRSRRRIDGRQTHLVTDGHRALVVMMRAAGATQVAIAHELNIHESHLREHYGHELDHGIELAGEKIARGVIFRAIRAGTAQAMPGDVTCALAYLKARMPGWRPVSFEERQAAAAEAATAVALAVVPMEGSDDTVVFYIPDHQRDHAIERELAIDADADADEPREPMEIIVEDTSEAA